MTIREGYSLTRTELKAIPPTQRTARSAYRVYPDNKWFGFVPTSTKAEDDDTVAPNTGVGRWEAMSGTTTSTGGGSGDGDGDGDGGLSDLQYQVDQLNIEVYTPDYGLLERVNKIDLQLYGGVDIGFIDQTEDDFRYVNSRLDAIESSLSDVQSQIADLTNLIYNDILPRLP